MSNISFNDFVFKAMETALEKEELHDDFSFIILKKNKSMNSNELRQIFNLHNKYVPKNMYQYATYCANCRNKVKIQLDNLVNIYNKNFKNNT